ncbi:preprotein translocase subunit SecE [Candidatus Giovannonibacteria bacterium RIFCSPHIGHO2_12_44_12]|uniref:Protein translocase subunit SecE n=3 Tax=Candidatus Giovannoniibacteriota TaxID=1752738 RepID=A0A1F5WXP6_9BACT|nr:MAG: preprotein translocase subunit SecE [Candidatus Giovannonibacteria bacterium RIFCSPHIGHO2_02_43_16]OGF80407.1 MAG: preprotein translocase subunit SecE [Candidatus Giovannonibacteria bacterium RIFCSPHIGHO2_12_44_12]OGF94643.1 MAG: preprotein translocase subunit SecE [Candidatus Giovannonibacteria bacterium RIFCSPLOWO2_12_43_8]
MNTFEKLINYIKETRLELRHVNWPSRQNTIRFTILVIGVSAALAAYVGLLDVFFQYLLNSFVFYG